jgi:hypothetical protein
MLIRIYYGLYAIVKVKAMWDINPFVPKGYKWMILRKL